jgi:hypothetical protein
MDQASVELDDHSEIHEDDFYFADMMNENPEIIQKRWQDLIAWKPGAGSHLRATYTKDSQPLFIENNLTKKKGKGPWQDLN